MGSVTPGTPRRRQHAAERHHREGQRRGQNRDRGQDEQELVDVAGVTSSLIMNFTAVGQRLAQPEQADLRQRNAHAIRAQTVLHPGRHPAAPAAPGRRPPSSSRRGTSAIFTSGTISTAASVAGSAGTAARLWAEGWGMVEVTRGQTRNSEVGTRDLQADTPLPQRRVPSSEFRVFNCIPLRHTLVVANKLTFKSMPTAGSGPAAAAK